MDNDSTSRTRDTLPLRLATAAIGIPLLALCVWLGGIPLLAITAAAAFLGIWELRVLLHPLGRVLWPLSVLIAAAFLYSGHTAYMPPTLIALTVIAGGSLGAALFTYRTGSWDGARSWTTTIGASVYPAALLATGLALRESTDGLAWLTYAILVTFASDTAAYATGRLIGRHKLSPSISPGKTWEGAAGAVICAAAISAAFAVIVQLDGLPVSQRHPPRSRTLHPRPNRRSCRVLAQTAGGRKGLRRAAPRTRRHPRPTRFPAPNPPRRFPICHRHHYYGVT